MDLIRYRQSIDDYRYLMLLDRLATDGRSPQAREARTWLDEVLSKMTVGQGSPFSDGELDQIQLTAVRYVNVLMTAAPASQH